MTYDNPILNEREKTHGSYADTAAMSQELKSVLRAKPHWSNMPAEVRETLEMICVKMARAVCGDWRHQDAWADISGYSDLARAVAEFVDDR